MSKENHNMNDYVVILVVIFGLLVGMGVGFIGYHLLDEKVFSKSYEENWITKYPHLIEGVDTSGKFYLITLDNGTKIETNCPSHTYPFETNDTSYICGNKHPIRIGDYNK